MSLALQRHCGRGRDTFFDSSRKRHTQGMPSSSRPTDGAWASSQYGRWRGTDTASRSSRASPASSLTRWGGSGRCSSRGGSGRRRWRRGRWRSRRRWFPWRVRSRVGVAERVWREECVCVRVNVRCVWVAFVCCCFACDCVLELVVCRVRCSRVRASCPWLRFGGPTPACGPCAYVGHAQPALGTGTVLT